jgi:hypothetical protein
MAHICMGCTVTRQDLTQGDVNSGSENAAPRRAQYHYSSLAFARLFFRRPLGQANGWSPCVDVRWSKRMSSIA